MCRKCARWGRRRDGLMVEYMQHHQPGNASPQESVRAGSPPRRLQGDSLLSKEEPPRDGGAGLRGQMSAVWRHKLSAAEKDALRHAAFPRLCIHGRQDIVAAPSRGQKVAEEMAATLVVLEGAHFLPRERGHEVNLCMHVFKKH